jgi:hypothetical protein
MLQVWDAVTGDVVVVVIEVVLVVVVEEIDTLVDVVTTEVVVRVTVTVVEEAVTVEVVVEGSTPKQLHAELYRTAPEQADAYAGMIALESRLYSSVSIYVVATTFRVIDVDIAVVAMIVIVVDVEVVVVVGIVRSTVGPVLKVRTNLHDSASLTLLESQSRLR